MNACAIDLMRVHARDQLARSVEVETRKSNMLEQFLVVVTVVCMCFLDGECMFVPVNQLSVNFILPISATISSKLASLPTSHFAGYTEITFWRD
jgi:hypothetical protein